MGGRVDASMKDSKKANIRVRHASATDNSLLAELGARTFHDTFAKDNTPENMSAYLTASFSPKKQAAELSESSSVFLIVEVDGEVVGFARLKEGKPPTEIAGSNPIEIVRIYACKEWIGHGVGATLMKACLNEAEKRGCDIIWIGVWERNSQALAFYLNWGFVEFGKQPFQLGDDLQNDLLLQRSVQTKLEREKAILTI